jgi:hypothetical protein
MTSFFALVAASMLLGQTTATPHHDELKVLEPLVGVWEMKGTVEEDSEGAKKGDKWDGQIQVSWVLDGKFLQTEWTFSLNDKQVAAGKQMSAWNPKTKKIVHFWCDSFGSHGTGEWEKQADHWVLHLSGVDATGKVMSLDRIVKVVGDTYTFQDTKVKEDGESKPDGEIVKTKRVAPAGK